MNSAPSSAPLPEITSCDPPHVDVGSRAKLRLRVSNLDQVVGFTLDGSRGVSVIEIRSGPPGAVDLTVHASLSADAGGHDVWIVTTTQPLLQFSSVFYVVGGASYGRGIVGIGSDLI